MTDDKDLISYKRRAVMDIGSNSVRLVIYELYGAHFSPVYNEKILAGLGRDLKKTGCLNVEGRKMALDALKRFKAIAQAQDVDMTLIAATAALRAANDAPEFIAEVKAETGLDITPVSGAEEARLTAMGLLAAEPRADGVAADLGGASLEFTKVAKGEPSGGISLPLGPYSIIGSELTDDRLFGKSNLRAEIIEHLSQYDLSAFKGQTLYLIGGAWRNLAGLNQRQMQYPMRTLQAYEIDIAQTRTLARWSYNEGREEILSLQNMSKRRAETLPYGGFLLEILLDVLSPSLIVISTTGLREGLIYSSLSKALKSRDLLLDGCRDLARGNLQAARFGDPLYAFLEQAADKFPRAFELKNETRLHKAACYLAGIGKGLHPDYRAKLVFDDVLYAPVSGLTHKERAYLALILFGSYTNKPSPPNKAAIEALLDPEERLSARLYGSAIRLAIVASGRTKTLLDVFDLDWVGSCLTLKVDPSRSSLLSDRVNMRLSSLGQLGGFQTESRVGQ